MKSISPTARAVKILPVAYLRSDGVKMIRTGPHEVVNSQVALILRLLPALRDEEMKAAS